MQPETGQGRDLHQPSKQRYALPCSGPLSGQPRQVELGAGTAVLCHEEGDPEGVNRIRVRCGRIDAEVLPSKGFSVGQVVCRGSPVFWKPPLKNLPEPAEVDPEAPLLVNGSSLDGFGWIRGFTGGVEMLGPLNWGMPLQTPDGRLLGLHGAAANIPVREATVRMLNNELWLTASFEVRIRKGRTVEEARPWYEAGDPIYRVTKHLIFNPEVPGFRLQDELTNLSSTVRTPDWGYHVQLHPQPEARYLVPSRRRRLRGGEAVNRDHEVWRPVAPGSPRMERGVVHRQAMQKPGIPDGSPGVPTLLRYPDGSGIEVILPPVPYLMSWFSAGGAGSDEFMIPPPPDSGEGSRRILERDWNGVGPEIGVSDLDHAGDVDPAIVRQPLEPGKSVTIKLQFRCLADEEAAEREREIRDYGN